MKLEVLVDMVTVLAQAHKPNSGKIFHSSLGIRYRVVRHAHTRRPVIKTLYEL